MGSDYSANACIDAGVRAANQCCQPNSTNTTNDIVEFDEDSVIIYDIVGCRVHSDTRPRSRYVFLLPGRLIHSSKTKNVKIGFTSAIEEYSQRGGGLDISYRTQIELLDSKCLRVWNRIDNEVDDEDDFTSPRSSTSKQTASIEDFGSESPSTSSSSTRSPSKRSMITMTESLDLADGPEDEYNAYSDEDVFKGIRRKELPSCIVMKFQTEDDMSPWVTLLEIEKNKINFPRHLFDPPVEELFIEAFEIAILEIFELNARNNPLKSFIFECRMSNGPGVIFKYLYDLFFSLVEHTDDLVDAAISFASFLDIVVSDASTAIIVLGFHFGPEIVHDLSHKLNQMSGRFSATTTATTNNNSDHTSSSPYNLSTVISGPNHSEETHGVDHNINDEIFKLKAPVLLNLVGYISEKVRKVKWRKNYPVLCDMFEYPFGSSIHSRKAVAWFIQLKQMKGRFKIPFSATWDHLRLLVEPSPYCGCYFLDQYVSRGEVDHAREVVSMMPYKTNVVFSALKNVPIDDDKDANDTDDEEGSDEVDNDDFSDIDYSVFGDHDDDDEDDEDINGGDDDNACAMEEKNRKNHVGSTSHHKKKKIRLVLKEVMGAHFIGFLEWEQVQRAYEEYEWANSTNAKLKGLLAEAKKIYHEPLVTTSLRNAQKVAEAKAAMQDTTTAISSSSSSSSTTTTTASFSISAAAAATATDLDVEDEGFNSLDDVLNDCVKQVTIFTSYILSAQPTDIPYVQNLLTHINIRHLIDRTPFHSIDVMLRDFVIQLKMSTKARHRKRNPELCLLKELYLKWILFTRNTSDHGKGLKTTLAITLLTVVCWADGKGSHIGTQHVTPAVGSYSSIGGVKKDPLQNLLRRRGKSIMAQLKDDEDRGLLLAMIAAFLVKHSHKKVHILYSSEDTMKLDFQRLSGYLASLKVIAACNDFTTRGVNVTYCLQGSLCQYYRYNVFRGRAPLTQGVVLLINDVDKQRIISEPLTVFAKRDDQLTKPMKVFFDLFLQIGDEATAPSDACGPSAKAAWNRALRAWEQYESMEEGSPNGYVFHPPTGRYEHLDEEGRMVPNKTSLGIDMVRYQYDDVEPIVQSLFFFQSMPFIISSYESIVCLGAAPKETDSSAFRNNRLCLQSLLNAWSFDVPSDRIEGFQLKGSRLNSLNLRSTVTTMQSTALDLKPAKPGAVNWLTTDLSVIFDSKEKQQQQKQLGGNQRQFADTNKGQHPSNPRSPTSTSSSPRNNGAGYPPGSTSTSSMGIGGYSSVATTTSMTATGTAKSSPPLSAATATATGSMASASGEILSGLVATSGLGLASLEESGSTIGTHGNGISSTMQSGGMLPGKVNSGGNNGLGRDTYVFGLLTLEKGQMMNELCERFYKKYPYEGGKWPDKPSHRQLIDFLDDDKLHTAEGVGAFAIALKLAKSVDAYFADE